VSLELSYPEPQRDAMTKASAFLLLACWAPTADAGQHGLIRHRSTLKFLTCARDKCTFGVDPAQIFTEVTGRDGQSSFKISLADGTSLGTCLDREHCHKSESNSRESDCGHCGAVHWTYNSEDGKLAEDHSKNCVQDDGSVKHCGDGHAPLEFVKHCTANMVSGRWVYKYTVATATTEKWKEGTSKTHTESKTREWSESVTRKVTKGWELEGTSGKISVGTTIGHQTSQGYSDEWSVSSEYDFTITWSKDDVGKSAWQFHFNTVDSCGHSEETLTHEYALTESAAREPCCVPGYSTDAPMYLTCLSQDAMVKDGAERGCKLASKLASTNSSQSATSNNGERSRGEGFPHLRNSVVGEGRRG
jgi:hypothetical protein